MAKSPDLSFNVNVFVFGMLFAVLISAIGFSESDATLQWLVPAIVLATATLAALFIPERRRRKTPPAA